jgi:hypothetical protein
MWRDIAPFIYLIGVLYTHVVVPLIIVPWTVYLVASPTLNTWNSVFFSWNLMYSMMQLGVLIDFFVQNKKRFDIEKEKYDLI